MMNKKIAIVAMLSVAAFMAATPNSVFATGPGQQNFSWTDCLGHFKSGSFTPSTDNTYNDIWKISWGWPSSAGFSTPCTSQNFNQVNNWIDDNTQGWSSESYTSTSTSNSGTQYTIYDYWTGNIDAFNWGDTMKAHSQGCYAVGYDCYTFDSSTWTA